MEVKGLMLDDRVKDNKAQLVGNNTVLLKKFCADKTAFHSKESIFFYKSKQNN